MGLSEAPSSPTFPALDPVIMDDEMESAFHNANMDFLDPTKLDIPSQSAGGDFDDLFARVTNSRPNGAPESSKHYQDQHPLRQQPVLAAESPAESPEASSRSSSSESPRNHLRHASIASTNSVAHSDNPQTSVGYQTEDWMRPELSSVKEESPFNIEPSFPMDGGFSMDPDLETSNKAMDAAFDFESAASSPSPLKTENLPLPNSHQNHSQSQIWSPSAAPAAPVQNGAAAVPSAHAPGSPLFAFGMKEQSPFSGVFSNGNERLSAPQWGGQSPSSLLEESFGGINMNGQSPLNSMSPNMRFGSPNSYTFPVNFASSPAQTDSTNSVQPVLTVHPTSLKSRVETQIPIRLTLSPLPAGVKKLRLPSHTISKLKFLAPPSTEPTPEVLQLYTSLVCTSAMQDREKLKRAFARTRSDRYHSGVNPNDEERPLDGGDVKICAGCIQRERKRASRKKQRKPEEDELFQKDEEKRVIVFNTSEIKEWTEPPKKASANYGDMPPAPPGSMQVELPMRIACYCRHQNEKLGFQVIFTVKDYQNNVVAQAITNSIMITDDHKTQAPSAPASTGPSPSLPDGTQLPGVGVFSSGSNGEGQGANGAFASPQSPTDLQGLQQRFSSHYQLTPSSFAAPQPNGGPSSSQTPRSLSRQASPTDFPGPQTKRRKHSSSGRLPSELTMTRLETPQSSSSAMTNAAQLAAARGYASPTERPFVTPSSMSGQYGNGPPTPNQSTDNNPFFNPTPAQRQSLDSLAQQSLGSAPNSAQPSRPGTPGGSGRNGFQDQNLALALGGTPANQVWPSVSQAPTRLPSVIHKLVPAEGSITGGTEVTLLGSGFYPGMEVVFGDTLATTTTFWGDKCLNCLTPPALQPGLVSVVFKHEHPTFGQVQQVQPLMPKQQLFFRYVDDRELQMYRLALNILGQKLGSQADAFQTAQQIMGSDPNAFLNVQKDLQGGGSSGGHQRQVPGMEAQGKLSDLDSKMLTYLEYIDLDDSPRLPRYNSRSTTGQTLLHFAASLGLTRFVAGLLARGANPDIQDSTGNAPMHLAALHGHAHIVHRLRLIGANANARSVRGFTPADLATTLPAHQAALLPSRHYRARSVGSLSSRRRHSSSASLSSLWEVSSASGSLGHAVDDSEDLDDSEELDSEDSDAPVFFSSSRRSSMHQDAIPPVVDVGEQPATPDTRGFSPPAAIVAWQNHLTAQIHQFQQSVANAFPNMPALPPMPALPDYQANQMMRRITNLVPHRPATRGDGWWDYLKGNASPTQTQPPSYDELYPHQQQNEEGEAAEMKKTALLRAATEAALDQHFEAQSNVASTSASASTLTSTATAMAEPAHTAKDDLKDITIGRKVISREQQKHLREHQARRMKGLGSDRNLYFIWIPLLLLVICAWMRNYVPGIWQGVTDGFEFVKARYTQRAVELGI
ncbi:hypothetical protein N7532_011663 [Penicillium argentinense]|uniref:IPT/TIG domain-containing protein n=1 Tax=Penicillium argentinense TaxID=1131581 RepID=A0A9W9JV60_9EURO|nr:uncharacterized protein N7532_011663 [Penicillium argentinense]KAJ5082620.1 hypothetical protein N7532_011663 [Penicillium argentinense]